MENNKFVIWTIVILSALFIFIISKQYTEIKTLKNSQIVVYKNDTIKNVINLYQPEDNIAFVPVTINGVSAMMMLDTGSGKCIVDLNQINDFELQLVEASDRIQGVGGSNLTWRVTNCSQIELNGVMYNVNLTVSNISNVVRLIEIATGMKIAGIIGSDFMTQHNAIIDFKQDKFFLVTK